MTSKTLEMAIVASIILLAAIALFNFLLPFLSAVTESTTTGRVPVSL